MKQILINAALAVTAVFMPAKAMFLTCLALVIVDLITGLSAARKRKEPITSSGIRRTVTKLLVYELAIALAYLTQKYLTGDSIPTANIVAGLIGITELVSCLENLNAISGQKLLKTIIDKLGSTNQNQP